MHTIQFIINLRIRPPKQPSLSPNIEVGYMNQNKSTWGTPMKILYMIWSFFNSYKSKYLNSEIKSTLSISYVMAKKWLHRSINWYLRYKQLLLSNYIASANFLSSWKNIVQWDCEQEFLANKQLSHYFLYSPTADCRVNKWDGTFVTQAILILKRKNSSNTCL